MRGVFPLLAFALFTFVSGCSDNDGSGPNTTGPDNSTGMGHLRIRLTDAPYPYSSISSADITVESVQVRMSDGFHTMPVDAAPLALNLLDLQNGVTEVLVDTAVPVGMMDQIRLIISSASVTLSDGRVFDLEVPSGESSGLKVFVSPGIQVADQLTTELLLDFDVSQSFKPIPASATQASEITRFQFHPVLRVANMAETGTVSGHIWNDQGTPGNTSDDTPIVGATVTSGVSGLVQGSTASGAQGLFRISGLTPGTQTLHVEAPGFGGVDVSATVVAANDMGGHEIRLVRLARVRTRTEVQVH